MSKSIEELEIALVGPRLWQELLDAALADALAGPRREAEERVVLARRSAEAIIATLHSRHVGITPEAAVGLARLLVGEQARPRFGEIWEAVTARLRRELRRTLAKDQVSQSTAAPATAGGFVLREAPAYTTLRLALPLFAAACARVGHSMLACADEIPGGVGEAGFKRYQDQLHHAVEAIAGSDEAGSVDPYAIFWAEIALTFSSGAVRPAAGRDTPALPASDPLALAWLLRIVPDPEPRLKDQGRPKVVTTPLKRQRSRRLSEGGITGYKLTRRIEDLSGIVHTELINPEPVFLDRILNSGYLTIERPPRHQKRRDVLVAGMLPPAAARLAAADLAKSCWFDCMWRFAVFLRGQELYRSELRWIEGDRADRARSASYLLQDLPMLTHDESFNPGDRWMFLKALRWVPSFLNRRDRPAALAMPEGETPGGGPVEARWCRAAWGAQRDNSRLDTSGEAARPWAEAVSEFAHVHLMVFLPAPPPSQVPTKEEAAENQGWRRLVSHFAAGLGPDVHTSVTWLPAQPLGRQPWRFVSVGRSAEIKADLDPRRLAANLEQIWLERLIKDTCGE